MLRATPIPQGVHMLLNILVACLTAAATIAAVLAARLEWRVQPQHTWLVRHSRELNPSLKDPSAKHMLKPSDEHTDHVSVFCEGDAIVHDVSVEFVGCTPMTPWQERWRSVMTGGADPVKAAVRVPAQEQGDAWVEIQWTTLRPLRRHGWRQSMRPNLRYQRWSWKFSSLRLQKRHEESLFGYRWVRTKGAWKDVKDHPLHKIPRSEPH